MSQDDETPTRKVGERLHVHVRVDGQQHDAARIGTVIVTPSPSHVSTAWGGISVSKAELARALRVLADSFDPPKPPVDASTDEVVPTEGWTEESVSEFWEAVRQGPVPENTQPDAERPWAIDREVYPEDMPIAQQRALALHLSTGAHSPVQYRDGLEPWCPRCGRRGDGRFPKPHGSYSEGSSGLAFATKAANRHEAKWKDGLR